MKRKLKTITLRLTEEELEILKTKSIQNNNTITEFLKNSFLSKNAVNKLTLNKLINKIKQSSKNEFTIKELFTDTEWKSFNKSSRLSVGRIFKKYIKDTNSTLNNKIEFIKKLSDNQSVYKKK